MNEPLHCHLYGISSIIKLFQKKRIRSCHYLTTLEEFCPSLEVNLFNYLWNAHKKPVPRWSQVTVEPLQTACEYICTDGAGVLAGRCRYSQLDLNRRTSEKLSSRMCARERDRGTAGSRDDGFVWSRSLHFLKIPRGKKVPIVMERS